MEDSVFTYRSARSGSMMVGLSFALLVETLVLHLWLQRRHPWLAWSLTMASILTIACLAIDYRALGRGLIRVGPTALDLHIGRRVKAEILFPTVAQALRPGWRDIPTPGSAAADYRNLMKPATPNVLLFLAAPVALHVAGGWTLRAQRLGLHLDDPAGFVAALERARSRSAPSAS